MNDFKTYWHTVVMPIKAEQGWSWQELTSWLREARVMLVVEPGELAKAHLLAALKQSHHDPKIQAALNLELAIDYVQEARREEWLQTPEGKQYTAAQEAAEAAAKEQAAQVQAAQKAWEEERNAKSRAEGEAYRAKWEAVDFEADRTAVVAWAKSASRGLAASLPEHVNDMAFGGNPEPRSVALRLWVRDVVRHVSDGFAIPAVLLHTAFTAWRTAQGADAEFWQVIAEAIPQSGAPGSKSAATTARDNGEQNVLDLVRFAAGKGYEYTGWRKLSEDCAAQYKDRTADGYRHGPIARLRERKILFQAAGDIICIENTEA